MKQRHVSNELLISNKMENLSYVRDFVQRTLNEVNLSGIYCTHIILAVDEAISNIIRHAYQDFQTGSRSIEIKINVNAKKIEIIIKDSGRNFDPNSINEPTIDEHVKLGKRYGLGLFLMRRVMDEIKYVFKSGLENTLTMVKYVEPNKNKSRGGN
ncbi:MAG: ATP-binding protein [Planctomycetota bacterium]